MNVKSTTANVHIEGDLYGIVAEPRLLGYVVVGKRESLGTYRRNGKSVLVADCETVAEIAVRWPARHPIDIEEVACEPGHVTFVDVTIGGELEHECTFDGPFELLSVFLDAVHQGWPLTGTVGLYDGPFGHIGIDAEDNEEAQEMVRMAVCELLGLE